MPQAGCPAVNSTVDLSGYVQFQQQLRGLKLTPAQRKRLGGTLARKVRVMSRKRLRAQRDLDGKPWQGRKNGRKGKMLGSMSKRMGAKGTDSGGEVFFVNGKTAQIAYEQQYGVPEDWSEEKSQKLYGKPNYKDNATRYQARALKKEGFKVRLPGGRRRKPSVQWITENLSLGRAGLILREMRNASSRNRWTIEIPKRSFLGVTDREINALTIAIFDQMKKRKGA